MSDLYANALRRLIRDRAPYPDYARIVEEGQAREDEAERTEREEEE